jgi:DNA replication and repair protein RecF
VTITSLSIRDFRCFVEEQIELDQKGLTVLHGPNGSGKTSVLEATGWLATGRSIRGAGREVVVRRGAERAILRALTVVSGRDALVELEIRPDRASRIQLDRRPIRTRKELAEALKVTVFSPGDRRLVDGGPGERREFLDDLLSERSPLLEATVDEVSHVLRQRAALLRQCGPRPDDAATATLDVWDARLAASGTVLAEARESLSTELSPFVSEAYSRISRSPEKVTLRYRRSWDGDLLESLRVARPEDMRRQLTTVGPHRDELEVSLGPSPARTHASQGEQRTIALALRLASHELRCTQSDEPPVLLLDDVFSELDPMRSSTLMELLPDGQVLLTTAVEPPANVEASRVVEVSDGRFGEWRPT